MSKRLILALAAAVAASAVALTYPDIGGIAYRLDTRIESFSYGLHKEVIDVGNSRMMSYQGGPADAPEAIVMIHGFSADKDVWMRFARHFTDRYRVLIIDLPGHGETPFDSALHYDAASQALRVVRAMEALGIQRAHIVGNSMGGFITARIALDHPERTRSATLIDASGVHSSEPSDMDRMLAAGGRNPFQIANIAEFDEFYAMTMAKAPWVPRMTLDYMAQRYISQREQLARIFHDSANGGFLDGNLGEIHVPVLVIWGAKDRLVHVSAARRWATGIVGAETIIYPDLGHMPMVEDPERSANDVLDFIERHVS
ncbi:MAG: alpha/beta hydrolase [Pseudomonadota bacterium]|nr:alpha/beta hydrolase [Pseudomonadota bacterium]